MCLNLDAFDVIGELTFGKPLGFLDQGQDVGDVMLSLEKMVDYAGMVSFDGKQDE